MIDGEVQKWRSVEAFNSPSLPPDDHQAYVGELVVGQKAGTLKASGGPCPIVSLYHPGKGLGALLHVNGGDAEIDGSNHIELLNALLKIVDFPLDAVVHVFMDKSPLGDETQEETRHQYAKTMASDIKQKGFSAPTFYTEEDGKYVMLNTIEGALMVFDTLPLYTQSLK